MLNQYRYHAGQFSVNLNEVQFTGDDVKEFLQNQSTFDINLLHDQSFHLATFLDNHGKVETYGWLVHDRRQFKYLFPESITEKTIERLNKYLISEDVTISEPVLKKIFVVIGPEAKSHAGNDSISGTFFDEEAYFVTEKVPGVQVISESELETWQILSGWPSLDGSDFSPQIINNLRLYDLGLVVNKGCYPGQETVSKINSGRGAAYSPVLIEVSEELPAGEIFSFDKKIGTVKKSVSWEGKNYLAAELLRDFRVAGMKINFTLNGKFHEGEVRYYPLISGRKEEKARELYYSAMDNFKQDDLKAAEEKFKLAIRLDPTFADAYEGLGVMLGRMNRYDEAIEFMQQLSLVDPSSVLAHTNMSLFLMKLGKIEEAEEQKSLATVKSFQVFGNEAKNKEIEDQRKKKQESEWAQRESMFKQVLEIDPDDTLANYGLGSIAVEKTEWDKAKEHLEKVIKADPKYSVAYLALGKAYKGLGMIEEARNTWKEGIKVSAAKGDLMPANQMQQELNFS